MFPSELELELELEPLLLCREEGFADEAVGCSDCETVKGIAMVDGDFFLVVEITVVLGRANMLTESFLLLLSIEILLSSDGYSCNWSFISRLVCG